RPPSGRSSRSAWSLLQYTPLFLTRRTVFMLGTTLDVRPFLERVGQELLRIDPGEVRALADAVYDCYQRGRFVLVIGNGGSGSNALCAVEWANRNGLKTFGVTGFGGGKLRGLAQQGLHVPLDDMGIVESVHLTAFHWVIDDLHRRIAEQGTGNREQGTGSREQGT